jgi:segregation and condensation protein B
LYLLFTSNSPLSAKVLARVLEVETETVETLAAELMEDLGLPGRGIQLRRLASGWRLETKPEHRDAIVALKHNRTMKPLSEQALETLAIVALKQPVSTEKISAIRGVNTGGPLQTLVKRKLILADAYGEGRGTYWRTTKRFLDEFGLESLDDIFATGKLERVMGQAYGLITSRNNSASNQSQESSASSLKNPAPNAT